MRIRQRVRIWFWLLSAGLIMVMAGGTIVVRALDKNLDEYRLRVITTEGPFEDGYMVCVKKQLIPWPYVAPYTYSEHCEPVGIDVGKHPG